MSEWRPEGLVNPWDVICDQDRDALRQNPIPKELPGLARLHQCERAAFNVGADAMLAALKERDGSEYYPPEEGRIQSGWVVFIPDEDK